MVLFSFLLCLVIISLPINTSRAAMDCPPECCGSETHYEGQQCAIKVLSTAEEELRRYLEESKRLWSDSPEIIKAIDKAQARWMEFREAACGAVKEQWMKGTGSALATLACKIDLTRRWTHLVWEYFIDGVKGSSFREPKAGDRKKDKGNVPK